MKKNFLSVVFIFCSFYFPPFFANARELYQQPGTLAVGVKKERIPELLAPKNFIGMEPFFAVSDRPTIAETLEEDLKNNRLVSPENHMIYCPKGGNYFSSETNGAGVVYIGAPNLPKNGVLTRQWFDSAYRHRADYNRSDREANVVIVSGRERPFLQVKCPDQHNHIIVAKAGGNAREPAPQMIIDEVKNLRYPSKPTVAEIDRYTLPSNVRLEERREKAFQAAVKQTVTQQKRLNIQDQDMIKAARKAAYKYHYFVKPILAIAKVSSDLYADKRGRDGQIGVMQIPPAALALYNLNPADVIKLEDNFMIGTRYFDRLMQRFGDDFDRALAAYYSGEDQISKIADPVYFPAEAKNFIAQVKEYLNSAQPVRLR